MKARPANLRTNAGPAWALLAASALVLGACSTVPGSASLPAARGLTAEELAETFDPADLYRGVQIGRAECARKKYAVWVAHRYGTECIRYYPSAGVDGAERVVFFFHGDVLDGRKPLPGASVGNSVGAKLAEAQRAADAHGIPFILVSRPGAFGSSGEHDARRLPKEFHSLDAAVDAIRARHRIREVVLAGQSGGATAVGALLTLGRRDVRCAVASSGGY
ncbi:MAG TPA: hypothetical protein VFO24_04785, partial [Usitatibacter sp.]|nr:hypothetical protein [Usitatibacter sp.]